MGLDMWMRVLRMRADEDHGQIVGARARSWRPSMESIARGDLQQVLIRCDHEPSPDFDDCSGGIVKKRKIACASGRQEE